MKINIIWHGQQCPQEHVAQVEGELAEMLGGMLDSPQQLISHRIALDDNAAVTVWGEGGDDAFHAEFHDAPTKERADKALEERLWQLWRKPY